MRKYVLPVVAGTITGMMLIKQGENLIGSMYPLPPGIGKSKEALANAVANMPNDAFLFLLLNYAICSFTAGLVATLVIGRTTMRPAAIAGVILTLGGLFNVISFPKQPAWFSITNLLVYLPFALLGYAILRKKGTSPQISPTERVKQNELSTMHLPQDVV